MTRRSAPLWRWRGTPLQGRLGRRILLWFLVLSLVPLFLSNTLGYLFTRRIMLSQIERYSRALAVLQVQGVVSDVARYQLYLDATAADGFISRSIPAASAAIVRGDRQAGVTAKLHEYLDSKLQDLAPLTELFVLDTMGTVVAATRHSRIGADWSRSDVFRRGVGRHFFAEDWDTRGGRPVPLYRLAVPVRNEQFRPVGVLVGTVGFDALQQFLHIPNQLAIDVHVFIVDRYGRPLFVSHPRTPIDYSRPLRSALIGRPAGSVMSYVNYEDMKVLGTSAAIPGFSWLYISEVPLASALGRLRDLALLAAGLELVFALILVTIVWAVARSIVVPLRRLVAGAERLRGGALGFTVQIDRDDELGDLGRTFNLMSSELQSSARRIEELHEQEMRRAAQLASVGELASGIAHEIKNPLVGVASGVDLLSRQVKGNAKAETILEQIRAQVHRMESAIHDLLSYARPTELLLVSAVPKQIVDRVMGLVRPQAEAAGLSVDVRYGGSLPTVRVDPELLTQALVNLALNAIQAMDGGGVLGISVESADGHVRFSISDTGRGIEPDQLDELFRPFYTTKHAGTGLGLTITRGIVERHGGRLEVDSRPGAGSTFTLVIPAEQQDMT